MGLDGTGKKRAREYGMEALDFTMHNPVSNVPPWLFPEVKTDFSIMEKKKEWRMEEVGVSMIQTGSVGIGIHIPEFKIDISKRITDQLSVYTAELVAVIIALQSNLIGLQYAQIPWLS